MTAPLQVIRKWLKVCICDGGKPNRNTFDKTAGFFAQARLRQVFYFHDVVEVTRSKVFRRSRLGGYLFECLLCTYVVGCCNVIVAS